MHDNQGAKAAIIILALVAALTAIDYIGNQHNNAITGHQTAEESKIPGFVLEKGWNLIGITDDMTGKTTNDVKGQCNIKYAFAYDNAANPRLMATPTQAARITNTFTGNAMWLYTQNKCRYNPEAKEATWAGTKDKLKTGQKAATTITNKITNKKLQDIKIRGCNIEKAWVYLPSGVSEQREEEESYVGWQSLLPNDFLGDGYTGKGMVIKAGQECTKQETEDGTGGTQRGTATTGIKSKIASYNLKGGAYNLVALPKERIDQIGISTNFEKSTDDQINDCEPINKKVMGANYKGTVFFAVKPAQDCTYNPKAEPKDVVSGLSEDAVSEGITIKDVDDALTSFASFIIAEKGLSLEALTPDCQKSGYRFKEDDIIVKTSTSCAVMTTP